MIFLTGNKTAFRWLAAMGALSTVYSSEIVAQQTTQNSQSNLRVEELIVTARKRDESILEVPLSVQAFTAVDLREAGMLELESLANMTPNLDFQNMGNSQPGRFNTAIRFRGMDTSITIPTNQTGAFFVDGINVLGGASSVSFSDIARIEVIKGPQPVYFGRGTFGGAVNYTTVDPAEEFGGYISTSYSPTFGSNEVTGYVEGALSSTLTGRLTGFSRTQGAAFTATDGGDIGRENTKGVSAILSFQPTERFRAKARIAYSEDDDGPASGTYVQYSGDIGNIPIGTPITVNTTSGVVDTTFGRQFFSGELPEVPVTNNTEFYDVRVGTPDEVNVGDAFNTIPYDTGTPVLNGFGLRTDMLVSSLAIDFEVNEALTLYGLFGYSDRDTTQVRDADQYDNPSAAVYTALQLESWSAEGRFSYDDGGSMRFLGGVNYAEADQFGDIDGGFFVWDGLFGGLQVGPGQSSLEVADITTLGVFASVEYDFNDWITAAFEARYQRDESETQNGFYGSLTPGSDLTFTEFLPRLSLTANPYEGSNIYLSYAEGTLPGTSSDPFAGFSDVERAEAQALFPFIQEDLDSENLQTYELGWKQTMLDGSLWFSLVGFWQEWENQKGPSTFVFLSPTTNNQFNISTTLLGNSTQKGVEFEARWQFSENFELQTSFGLTDATYDDFAASGLNSTLGLPFGTNFLADGNTLPRSPKQSGALSATWTDELEGDWGYYIRGDYVYRGKTYTDELNLNTIGAYSLINFRVGIETADGLGLEAYCSNCADESGWATGRRFTDFGLLPANFFTGQGAVVDPISPREFGVRVSYGF